DMNGDGKVKVTLDQFYFPEMSGETDQVSYNTRMSSEARLCADISENISFLFIMDDPALVQAITGALSYPDGTLPDDDDVTAEGKYLQWQDCPELASLGLDEYFSSMYIARRGFWRTETVPNADLCQELWNEWRE
ncbi:MAG: hypothetical protein HUJ69_00385, partial [Lachnospiraceae bacterium]|nr:hypothetical protein [Lachnospiraceae bacterium]